jgi:Na+:H+ antiporter, NhaA family
MSDQDSAPAGYGGSRVRGDLSLPWLSAGALGLAAVVVLRRVGVTQIAPYVALGVATWIAVHESGVHATIAGVALGLLTPTGQVGGRDVLASTACTF